MTELNQEVTAEEIARHYSAAMDSVNLINSTKPENTTDEEWEDTIKRNVDHLKIMVSKDFMQDQDLAPLEEAIEANE
jgi:hypothetical protein